MSHYHDQHFASSSTHALLDNWEGSKTIQQILQTVFLHRQQNEKFHRTQWANALLYLKY